MSQTKTRQEEHVRKIDYVSYPARELTGLEVPCASINVGVRRFERKGGRSANVAPSEGGLKNQEPLSTPRFGFTLRSADEFLDRAVTGGGLCYDLRDENEGEGTKKAREGGKEEKEHEMDGGREGTVEGRRKTIVSGDRERQGAGNRWM
eukprot:768631-Hanusia_phi.AAC.3